MNIFIFYFYKLIRKNFFIMNRYFYLLLFAKIVKKVDNFKINLGIYYRLKNSE